MNITSIDELKNLEINKGEIVELPGFVENKPFVVRLKKPSLLALAKNGKIPNPLLADVEKLFFGGTKELIEEKKLGELSDLFLHMAKITLVEPSYLELEKEGIELTDLQLIDIVNHATYGVKGLSFFRKNKTNFKNSGIS